MKVLIYALAITFCLASVVIAQTRVAAPAAGNATATPTDNTTATPAVADNATVATDNAPVEDPCIELAAEDIVPDGITMYDGSPINGRACVYGARKRFSAIPPVLVREIMFEEGVRVLDKLYYMDGVLSQETSYKDDQLTVKVYYPSGTLAEEANYKNGLLDGANIKYHEDGSLDAELSYKAGKKDGLVKWYHAGGVLKQESEFKADQLYGPTKMYDINGTVVIDAVYKNGKREGSYKRYYPDGKLLEESNYSNGQREESYAIYNNEEKPLEQATYKNGQFDGERSIYNKADATLWAKITYKNGIAMSGVYGDGKEWNRAELLNCSRGVTNECREEYR
ncbi:MAG: toxin-antitoxin system YwqK family antitoxin [Deferribacteraceae bacterium]|jgi:antitoxin component YwqK of YwqJK toxin-antitoxin module|nr:toxin-antitoxin system YwqK family antitoxin [Deferribacteraceae bacterium]